MSGVCVLSNFVAPPLFLVFSMIFIILDIYAVFICWLINPH